MLKLFFDQNFDHRIVRGLIMRIPNLDYVTTQILNKEKAVDPKLLNIATEQNRIIVTHDKKTFPRYAYAEIDRGQSIRGVLIVPRNIEIGRAVDELEIIVRCSFEDEYENRVEYLPLGLTL